MAAYATRRDVYRYGLARGVVGMPGRLVSTVTTATNRLELDGHGFEDDEQLVFRALEGGTLPSPLSSGTTYYARRVSDSIFEVAATAGGAAIDITTSGSGVMVAVALDIDGVLETYSRVVDGYLVGHPVPLTAPYPAVVTMTVAELAAHRLQILSGQISETMTTIETEARARLAAWAKGILPRDPVSRTGSNLAVSRSATSSSTDPRGWGTGSLP